MSGFESATVDRRSRVGARLTRPNVKRRPGQLSDQLKWPGLYLAAILAGLCWFLSSTFATGSICWAMWLLTTVLSVKAFLGSGTKKRGGAAKGGDQQATPIVSRRSSRLRAFAATLLSFLAAIFVVQWRVGASSQFDQQWLLVAIDSLAHTGLAIALVLWGFYPVRGHVLMLPTALIAAAMTVVAGGVSATVVGQTAFALTIVGGFLIASQVILSWDDPHQTPAGPGGRSRIFGSKFPLTLLFGLMILMLTSLLTQWTTLGMPTLQSQFYSFLRLQLEESAQFFSDSSRYVSGRKLGNILSALRSEPRGIALRGYSDRPPGYLRGEVFDSYQWGQWSAERTWNVRLSGGQLRTYKARRVEHVGKAQMAASKRQSASRFRFLLSEQADSDRSIGHVELVGDPEKGNTVFMPLQTCWVEAATQEIALTAHGEISDGIDHGQPYVAGVAQKPKQESLSAEDRALLLTVDSRLADSLGRYASRLCQGATTAQEKAARIANHFQSAYLYSLDHTRVPRDRDPVEYFLLTHHAAHCEYFASATALLLRCVGVPTRYVTGYVMEELSDSQDYYLARNRDAHAWVEYYDDASRRWRPVESTPGRSVRMLEAENDEDDGAVAGGDLEGQQAGGRIGWLSRFLFGWFRGRATEVLIVVFRVLQALMIVLLVAWLIWRRRSATTLEAAEAKLIRQRYRMDRRLRRWGWRRRSSETLHQFAARLQSAAIQLQGVQPSRADDLRRAADWYRRHAVTRYRGFSA